MIILKKILFYVYVKFIRPYTSRTLSKVFSTIAPHDSTLWEDFKHLPMEEFSKVINDYEYKPDPLKGALDFTYEDNAPAYFFSDLNYGRDCDDWARMWTLWGRENGYTAQEVIVTTEEHITTDAHVITILEKDREYWCMNYEPYGPYASFERAVNTVKKWKRYNVGTLMWSTYNTLGKKNEK